MESLKHQKIIIEIFFILTILAFGVYLRVHDLNFTGGLYLDEASMAYDAFSLGKYGIDQYGKTWPIYLRSFATYQSPLYTYLSILPIKLFGLSTLGIRFISIISGILLIIISYFFCKIFFNLKTNKYGLATMFILSFSPWHIIYSRNAIEANLSLTIYIVSLLLLISFINDQTKKVFFLFGIISLALTNYGYHAYRIVSIITLVFYVIFFWQKIKRGNKKFLTANILLFFLIIFPQLKIINTTGSIRRIQSTEYFSNNYYHKNGTDYQKYHYFGHALFILSNLSAKFTDYLSPNSLFSDSDQTEVKSIINLSSFFVWMVIGYFVGLYHLIIKGLKKKRVLFILFLAITSLIPASVTTDNLYYMRSLGYLFFVTLLISYGFTLILQINYLLKSVLLTSLIFYSMFSISINYFTITKKERDYYYCSSFYQVFDYMYQNKKNIAVVDFTEQNAYILALFRYQYDPILFSKQINLNLGQYYNDISMPSHFTIENVQLRKIDWSVDVYKEGLFLAGDENTLPEYKAKENNLTLVKSITTPLNKHYVSIYQTNPKEKCLSNLNRYGTKDAVTSLCNNDLLIHQKGI